METMSNANGLQAAAGSAWVTAPAPGSDEPAALPLETVPAGPSPSPQNLAGMNVLVCDEHYKHSLGIVRHLGRLGVHVRVVAASKASLACRSRFCREVILAKSSDVGDLVEAAWDAVRSRRFDLVIPVSYSMTLAIAGRQEAFCRYTRVELAELATIEKAADKLLTAELARSVGVPVPQTMPARTALQRANDFSFPVVIKPRREYPGRPPVRYASGARELREILSSLSAVAGTESELLVQEFVPGSGCGFFALYQRGVCRRVFMHRRVREYPPTGGVSTCAESFYDSQLEIEGRRILDALNWHGVAMVEFRRDRRDGSYQLIEVNPKFWGSLDLALDAGAHFPADLCRMALGDTLAFTDRYRRKLRFHWPLSSYGELFHLWTRPSSLVPILLDCLNPFIGSNLWPSDPAPNFQEMRSLAGQFFRSRKG